MSGGDFSRPIIYSFLCNQVPADSQSGPQMQFRPLGLMNLGRPEGLHYIVSL